MRSRTGILKSWCKATSQFLVGDLSKQRALYCDCGGRKMFSDRAEALEAQRELNTAGVMK